ncbi:hypothetical protein [Luteimonas rhizosphaerae]|uniref:hypothetical protein n=1 Tax=Luteimonas sp. 4-12 TaxID=2027406 RepID=UPI0011801F06|nr:hypothetical protein [Luteimonas sp. 4-12]
MVGALGLGALGWWLQRPVQEAGASEATGNVVSQRDASASRHSVPGPKAGTSSPVTAADTPPSGNAAADSRTDPVASGNRAPRRAAPGSTQPAPLSIESEARVAALVAQVRRDAPVVDDTLALWETEARDPVWSEAMERRFEEVIRSSDALGGLEISTPRCTATVCVINATQGAGTTQNCQRLMQVLHAAPGMADAFVDQRTSVGYFDGIAACVSTFLRPMPA